MTGLAGDFLVLADQGILRFRVVELRRKRTVLPRCRAVTGLASLLELAAMRISVAG